MKLCFKIGLTFSIFTSVSSLSLQLRAGPTTQEQKIQQTIGRNGDFLVSQLLSQNFQHLSTERRLYAYYVSKAIDAAGDIYWKQATRYGVDIRSLFTEIWKNKDYLPLKDQHEVAKYFFKILASQGNYSFRTMRKILPETFQQKDLLQWIQQINLLRKNDHKKAMNLPPNFITLVKHIFSTYDMDYLASQQSKDPLQESNSNFYSSEIKHQDFVQQPEDLLRNPYGRFKKVDGQVVIDSPRIHGLFSDELMLADKYFEQAKKFANSDEVERINSLQKAMRTGNAKDYDQEMIEWLKTRPTDVDFVFGFTENYLDPLGVRVAYTGYMVLFTMDPNEINRTSAIRKNAAYFENKMPVNSYYKNPNTSNPPTAVSNDLISIAGFTKGRPFLGVNQPGDKAIAEEYGTKSFMNLNMQADRTESSYIKNSKPFYALENQYLLDSVDTNLADKIHVEFHEILGHGSGRFVDGASLSMLKELYSPGEEARADTASLFHSLDPELGKLGILPAGMSSQMIVDLQKMVVLQFFTDHLKKYDRLPDQEHIQLQQAHMWGNQVMLNFMLEKGALSIRLSNEGVPFVELQDLAFARKTLGELWAILQTAISTGNYDLLKELFDSHGYFGKAHQKWKAGIQKQLRIQNPAREVLFLNPKIEPIVLNGKIIDAQMRFRHPNANPIENAINEYLEHFEIVKDEQKSILKYSKKSQGLGLNLEEKLAEDNKNQIRCDQIFAR